MSIVVVFFFRYPTRGNLYPNEKNIYTFERNNEMCEFIESSYFTDLDPE